ncbi:MAG TPA: polysaccharide deacetylase family protein [Pyrinomonadaceae bacterium]|jgi:peptidoglycan/xylan/chitin deacetylase (PgdA/CDA1 family)|nr:polysaccharide deacetylase family protein [Pyrinomonadaceae bacterium]
MQHSIQTPARTRPLASLSLDLDNKWAYLKTHGDAGWREFPSYLDVVVPRALDFLRERGLTITFFVVGQDAALDKNLDALRQIAPAGHEIGNHSFHHEPWLHLYSEREIEQELSRAEDAIERATGERPLGFRGPGFSLSHATLRVLARRGYLYDASTFPTFLGPLARAYYFMTAKLTDEEREKRKALFGTLRDGLQPVKPYRWRVGGALLTEIPVTTMPLFKLPIHVSYLLYLGGVSRSLALRYFQTALAFCCLTGTQPSLLLHPLDFLGVDDTPDLAFFPAMRQTSARKLQLVGEALRMLSAQFDVVTMREHARAVLELSPEIPLVEAQTLRAVAGSMHSIGSEAQS